MKHDLSRLTEQGFEHLAQALMMAVFGIGTQVYGDGPDGGRDGTYDGVVTLPEEAGGGSWAGYGVMQAKFLRRPHGDVRDARWLVGQLNKEFKQWTSQDSRRAGEGRTPDYLLVVTNIVLSPVLGGGGIDRVERLISQKAVEIGLKGWWVWHYDTLCRLLEMYPGIRRSYTGEILPGDVLASVLERMASERREGQAVVDGRVDRSVVCPYKGLSAFTASDTRLFFGREQLTSRLVARLSSSYRNGRPLIVLGASGAGKSSTLAAGLLPALRQGSLGVPGSNEWPHVIFSPTARPLHALAVVLTRETSPGLSPADLAEELARAPEKRVLEILGRDPKSRSAESSVGSGSRRIVVVADQFEELFTLCDDRDERAAFLKVITAIAGRPDDAVTPIAAVVLGIRADFVEHLAGFPILREALEEHPVFVGPMSPDEVRSAIERPAVEAGLSLEPGLTDAILEDLDAGVIGDLVPAGSPPAAGHHVGHLPLLSHALLVTCQRSGGDRLTLAAYHATGGIRRAVASTAEAILSRFDEDHREIARRLLLDLVRIGEGTDDTRRQVPLERLVVRATDPLKARDVLIALAASDARLITIHEHHVEITHEALLRAWPTLRRWIDSDRAGQVLRQRLEDDANLWCDDDRAVGHLYTGHRLASATAWVEAPRNRAQLSPRARDFHEASQRHVRHLRRRAVAVVAVFVILVTAGGVTALVQWQRALDREQAAERARRAANAESLLARADVLREEDPRAALRLGVAAEMISSNPRARMNLLSTLAETNLVATLPGHTATVNALAFDENTGTLVTGSSDGTAFLWNLSDPDHPKLLAGPFRGNIGGVLAAAFTPDGSVLATSGTGTGGYGVNGAETTRDADVILWDISDPTAPRRIGRPLTGHSGNITSVAITADGKTLVTGSMMNSDQEHGAIILWDITNPSVPQRLSRIDEGLSSGPRNLAVSPDGRLLAVGTEFGAGLWDIDDRAMPRPLATVPGSDHDIEIVDGVPSGGPLADLGRVNAVAFISDQEVLATGGPGGVSLWDVQDPGKPRQIGSEVTSAVTNAVAVSRDGSTLATGTEDGHILIWDISRRDSPLQRVKLTGHRDGIHSMAFVDGASMLATGSYDSTTALWRVISTAVPRLLGPPGPAAARESIDASYSVMSAAQSLDGAIMAVQRQAFSLWDEQIGGSGQNGPFSASLELWDLQAKGALQAASTNVNQTGDSHRPVTMLASNGTFLLTNSTGVAVQDSGSSWWYGPVDLWDTSAPAAPRRIARLAADGRMWGGSAFDDTGSRLVVMSQDNKVELWDLADRSNPRRYPVTDRMMVFKARFAVDGNVLVLLGVEENQDGSVLSVWNTSIPSAPRQMAKARLDESLRSGPFALTADGRTLALAASEGSTSTVSLWDLSKPAAPRRLGGALRFGRDGIQAMEFSQDGSLLAVEAGPVSFWAVADPAAPLQLAPQLPPSINSSSEKRWGFTDDDGVLAVTEGGRPSELARWDTSGLARLARDTVAISCRISGGGLTPAEWSRYLPDLPYLPTCDAALGGGS